MIGVVIPYYQTDAGILRRCLDSIVTQRVQADISVVIIDDESPWPAGREVAGLSLPSHVSVIVLSQANGGPGVARNAGIDHAVAAGADVIAFVDSDDAWKPHHLEYGLAALASGFDMYCSNWSLASSEGTGLESKSLSEADTQEVPGCEYLARLSTPLVEQEVRNSIVKLSCLVVRPAFLGETRFDRELRYASEDRVFTFTLAAKEPAVAISFEVGVRAGRGVSIYESVAFGSRRTFKTLRDQLIGRRKILEMLDDSDQSNVLSALVLQDLAKIRRQVALNFGSCMRSGRWGAIFDLLGIFYREPTVLFHVVADNARVLASRISTAGK